MSEANLREKKENWTAAPEDFEKWRTWAGEVPERASKVGSYLGPRGVGRGGRGGRSPPNVLMCWFEKIRRFFSLIIVFSFIVCYNCLMIIVLKKILACISLFFFLMFLGVLLWFIIDIIYIYLYSLSPLTL